VQKIRRITWLALCGIIGLFAIVLLGANLYVQSQGTQARIQQELSQRLGTPLHIGRISVTPWGGLKLSGITIPQTNPTADAPFLEAKTFRLRIRLASLFSQRLVIKEVSLLRPEVVWAQNADGKWRLPTLPKDIAAKEESAAIPAPEEELRVPEPAQTPALPSTASSPPRLRTEPARPVSYAPEIRRVNLSDGSFRFLDENGKAVATFSGVNFRSSLRNATALRGTVRIAKTSLRDRFFLERLQSPLQYDPAMLDLSQVSAAVANGQVSGRFTMHPQEHDSPFTASVKFTDVQADEIVTNAGGDPGVVQGKLEGNLTAVGNTADANALSGSGEIYLRDGKIQQYSLLVALGKILQIEELAQLNLDQASVKYHLTPGLVTVDELLLRSPNIQLSAKGTITFGGKLRLESQLAVNEKIRGQLFSTIRDNFNPTSDPAFAAVDFQVSGTVGRPKTNLMDKLVGQDLKDLGSVINSLLGGKKSGNSKKKKHRDDASGAVAESPSPGSTAPTPSPEITATPAATP
jgi:type II secretion system protein N